MQTRWLLVFAAAICACSDRELEAPLSPVGGPGVIVDQGRRDGGDNVDDGGADGNPDAADAGMDGPAAGECAQIEPFRYTTDEIPEVTATTSPEDFLVSRHAATWRDRCSDLVIELSDGKCPAGNGHELEILLSADAVEDGQIGLGLNFLEAEAMAVPGFRVRYTRPQRFSPVGVYGSCEGATGSITFYEAPDLSRSKSIRATYEFRLTPCDGNRNPAQEVSGHFNVRVRRPRVEACPPP